MTTLWWKARQAADAARLLHEAKNYDGAVNRAYYAMFNAARSLLTQRGISAANAKRHSTVWRQFSLHFVASGLFDTASAAALSRIGELRSVADYTETVVTSAVAESVMQSMERFMAAAEQVIGGDAPEENP